MSIDDQHCEVESPTDKLQLFTGRDELICLFAAYLNEDPPNQSILYFHGDGGNGKSLLLKFLREKCCKRFPSDIWEQLKAQPATEIVQVADYIQNAGDWEGAKSIPAVLLDFGQQPRGDDQPQDSFYGLLKLRRNLAAAASEVNWKLKFPLYDFACIWWLHKQGKSTEEIQRLFPLAEIAGLIAPLIDLVNQTPVGSISKAVFDIFAKDLGKRFNLYLQRRQLTAAQVEEVRHKDPETELIDALARWFAQDLNAAMTQEDAPPRLVLFFDTHEAFWGHQRNLPEETFFYQDEWLRRLLRALALELGIVVVVAGRETPRWAEAAKVPIPQAYLDIQLVGHLSAQEARCYLRKLKITDAALVEALIDYASVRANQVHPFYLGLGADVVLSAVQQGTKLSSAEFASIPETEQKTKALMNRLLCYVDEEVQEAVHALSACRAFDESLYLKLGQGLHFHATAATFRMLTRFSFVWQEQALGQGYRIHDLLRRLDDESGNPTTRHAHQLLEEHYREQGGVAEAIYHANRLDWKRGVEEWLNVFYRALRFSHLSCRTLLEVRSEFVIGSDLDLCRVSCAEGDYFSQLARYQEAEREYLEAISAAERMIKLEPENPAVYSAQGMVLQNLAQLVPSQEANQRYQQAIAAYEQAIRLDSADAKVYKNKGISLRRLAQLQASLGQSHLALQTYQQAIAAFDKSLGLNPDYAAAHNTKGNALRSLGELQAQLGQHSQAFQTYQEALRACNWAFRLAPELVYALNNQGLVLRGLGNLQAQLGEDLEAGKFYQQAIRVYKQALVLAPNDVYIAHNQGEVLKGLGDLQLRGSQLGEALESYQEAVVAYSQALELAPNFVEAHQGKGLALWGLGDVQAQLSQQSEAFQSWQAALIQLRNALEIVPGDAALAHLIRQLEICLSGKNGE